VSNVVLPLGRYGFPKFSPVEDDKLVYQRFGGDSLSGSLYSRNAGIYIATKTKQGNVRVCVRVRVCVHQ
jgi:hypothetical protein